MKRLRNRIGGWLRVVCICLCGTSVWAQAPAGSQVTPLGVQARTETKQRTYLKVELQLDLDTLHLKRKQSRVFTPVLTDGTNSCALRPVLVNGTWRHYMYLRDTDLQNRNALVVKAGKQGAGMVEYADSCLYSSWMQHARLWLAEDLCGCGGDPMKQSRREVAMAMNLAATIAPMIAATDSALPPKKAGEIQHKVTKVILYLDYLAFPINGTELLSDFGNNRKELLKLSGALDSLLVLPQVHINEVCMTGYASPDGPYSRNDELAYKRTLALRDYLQAIRAYRELSFRTASVAEDWDGLKAALQDSDMPYREELLMIIATTLPPDKKEENMKRLDNGKAYDLLKVKLLPSLRRTICEIHYTENRHE